MVGGLWGRGAWAVASSPSLGALSSWMVRRNPSASQKRGADMTLCASNRGSFGKHLEKIGDSPSPPRGSSRPLDSQAADGRAKPKRRRSIPSSEPPEIEGGLSVTFDLGTLEWKQHQGTCSVPKGCSLASALGVLIPQNDDDDDSHVEAASNWGEQLLDSGGSGAEDSIDTRSELCDVEKTVTAAVQILHAMALMERDADWEWAQNLPQGQQWCVGGSILATYEARDRHGCAQSLVLVTCRELVSASSSSSRVGSQASLVTKTCERHCVVQLEDVMVDGQWWQTLQLKKCTWACCARSRPFASPPEIPWGAGDDAENGSCHSCAQQESLEEREDQASPLAPAGIMRSPSSSDSDEDLPSGTAAAATHTAHRPPVRPSMPPKNV